MEFKDEQNRAKSNAPKKRSKTQKYYQGYFKPNNPKKYTGDVDNIIYRSMLEKRFFKWFDDNRNIVQWQAEEFSIKYISPLDKEFHRYYVDVIFVTANGDMYFAEIKPSGQTVAPKKPKRMTAKTEARYLEECKTYAVNLAKWKAADSFAKLKGAQFITLTENMLKNVRE